MFEKNEQPPNVFSSRPPRIFYSVLMAATFLTAAQDAVWGQTAASSSAPATQPAVLSNAAIDQLINQLADNNFNAREKAQADLIRAGRQALSKLRSHEKSEDEELNQRLQFVIFEIWRKEIVKNSEEISNNVLWKNPIDRGCVNTPIITGGIAYVISPTPKLFAIDAATGKQLWSKENIKAGRYPPSIAVGTGAIYVSDRTNIISALKADTGEKIWDFDKSQTATQPASQPAAQNPPAKRVGAPMNAAEVEKQLLAGLGIPVLAGELVLVVDDAEKILAIDAKSGQLKWECPMAGCPFGQPAVAGNSAVWLCTDGSLAAVDIRTGKIAWTQDKKQIELMPAGNVIFCRSDYHGKITAMNATTGESLWEADLSAYGDSSSPVNPFYNRYQYLQRVNSGANDTSIIAANESVYAIIDDCIVGIDSKTGKVNKQCKVNTQFLADAKPEGTAGDNPKAVIQAQLMRRGYQPMGSISLGIFVGIRKNQAILIAFDHILAIDIQTGDLIWRINEGSSSAQPVLADDVLYIPYFTYRTSRPGQVTQNADNSGLMALKAKLAAEQK